MPENTWVPKYSEEQLKDMPSESTKPLDLENPPEVGQSICIQLNRWGGVDLINAEKLSLAGHDVLICKIEAIKKTKLVLE